MTLLEESKYDFFGKNASKHFTVNQPEKDMSVGM